MSDPLFKDKLGGFDNPGPDFSFDHEKRRLKLKGAMVHSAYDPIKEAKKLARELGQVECSHIVIFGLGLGYLVRELLDLDLGKPLVLVEPKDGSFKIIEDDLDQRLGTLPFFFSHESGDFRRFFETAKAAKIYLYANNAYTLAYPDDFGSIEEICGQHNFKKEVNNNTLEKFGKLWVRNFLRNYPLVSKTPGIEYTKQVFVNMPALVLAAGPSLDHFLPKLKDLSERMLVCVVDTSLRASLEWGVEPDFCVMMDPQYWNSRHIDGLKTKNTIFVSDSSVIPRAIRGLDGRLLLCQSIFPLAKLLDPENVHRGPLAAGGSVATSAWDLMRSLNPSAMWTMGLDLSYPKGETHFKGSFFEAQLHHTSARIRPAMQGFFKYLHDANLERSTTAQGELVYTDNRMSLYSRWFESMVPQTTVPNFRFSMGARHIEGFKEANLDDILALKVIRPEIDAAKESLCAKIAQFTAETSHAPSLFKVRSSVDKIIDLSHQAIMASKEALSKSSPDLGRLNKLDAALMQGSDNRIVGFLLEDAIQEISLAQKPKDLTEAIKRSELLYARINLEANYLKKLLIRYGQD